MDYASQETLHKVEHNDATLTVLKIGSTFTYRDEHISKFNSSLDSNLSRLGRYIGENTHIEKVIIDYDETTLNINANRGFLDGLRRNSSIKEMKLVCVLNMATLVGGALRHEILNVYEEKNSLLCLHILYADHRNNGSDSIINNALGRCTNLRQIKLHRSNMTDENLLSLIESIRGLSSLEKLELPRTISISDIGCEAISTLLEDPHCNLQSLDISGSGIGSFGAGLIADRLANNTKLKELDIGSNQFDKSLIEDAFSNILCNETRVNNVFISNHTLEVLYLGEGTQCPSSQRLVSLLQMNKGTNKRYVAIKKMLKYHPNIDVSELFGWGSEDGENTLKALPFLIDWFDKARNSVDYHSVDQQIAKQKLSAIYQFVRAMPLQFV